MDVSFIVDGDLLEKYNTVEDKVSAEIKKEFDSEPVYDKNYLKTKIKCRGNDVTEFYDKKIPQLDSNHTCSAVTTLDFAITKDEYYSPPPPPPVFLKECNHTEKKWLYNFMIICAIFLILLMSLMKNRFSFNERTKAFLLCKRLPSPDYKEVFFLTLSTGY